MAVLVVIAAAALVVWVATNGARARRSSPPAVEEARVDVLVDALYRDGVKVGYQSAFSRQILTENQRVQLYIKRRNKVLASVLAFAVILGAVPAAGSVGALPGQAEWAGGVATWHWLVLLLGVAVSAVVLAFVIMPRDYARFFTSRGEQAATAAAAETDIENAVSSRLSSHLEVTKAYLARMTNERYAAGVEQGRRMALDASAKSGQDSREAVQARISSAANAAYVQGRSDGAAEARNQAGAQLSEAYRRGVSDGERSILVGLEGRLRAERASAYEAGFRAGVLEGRASSAQTAQAAQAASGRPARPRTRAESLKLLDLVEGSSLADVEKRYKELRAAVHPDAIRSKRLPPAMVAFAEEHFKLVGEAYDILRR